MTSEERHVPTRQDLESFVPADFAPPTRLDHAAFRLRPLGTEYNERDHAAWMGSIDHIHATPGSPDGSRVRADLDAMLAMTVREWLEDVWPWRPERIREHPRAPAS
jgi:hypothetical protein